MDVVFLTLAYSEFLPGGSFSSLQLSAGFSTGPVELLGRHRAPELRQ